MKFIYPLELTPKEDFIAVQEEEGGPIAYEPVMNVYRQGEKVVVETDCRMLRLDPGLKVQARQ